MMNQTALDHLENWLHDAMCDYSPEEVHDCIMNAVKENLNYHQKELNRAQKLFDLLSGNKRADFWRESTGSLHYTDEELDAMCDAAEKEEKAKRADKVVRWQLPTQVDGLTGDVFVTFPDDLLDAANLKEGDTVEWGDQGDGSYLLRKVND